MLFHFSFLTMTTDPEEQKLLKPLMLTAMFLQIPKISIKPTLEEIQAALSQVNYCFIIKTSGLSGLGLSIKLNLPSVWL